MIISEKLAKRKAIATVIGSVFFLVLMTAGLSVSYLVIETQSDMIQAQQTIADSEIKKIQEKFYTSASTGASNRLSLYVENEGSNTLEIDKIWIVNKTDPTFPAKKYDVNYAEAVLAPGYGTDILQNTPLFMDPGTYDVKVVSSLGTIKTADQLDVGGPNKLKAKMIIDPPDVRIGENATAWIFVTNTGNTKILNVTTAPVIVTPSSAVVSSSPVLQPLSDLAPAESTILAWKYNLKGTIGTNVTFSTYATGVEEPTGAPIQSNIETTEINLRDNGDLGSIITQTLFSKPEIFMIIPAPFGESPQKGLWGVNIVNPTSQPIYVSKVVINAISPRNQAQDQIFYPNGCNPVSVSPTPNSWICDTVNQLVWKNPENPQMIPPQSVFPFLAKVEPGTLGGSAIDLETVLIQTNVFTTLGQFGKAGYGSAFDNDESSVVNVYFSQVPESTDVNHLRTNMTAIKAGSTVKINATIADFDTDTGNVISAGARLLVNIPKGWTEVAIQSHDGFSTPAYHTFPDTSSQIEGILNQDITGASDAKTIQFTVKSPPVPSTQMYVMFVLAEGEVNNSFPVGPLAEIVLQVVP